MTTPKQFAKKLRAILAEHQERKAMKTFRANMAALGASVNVFTDKEIQEGAGKVGIAMAKLGVTAKEAHKHLYQLAAKEIFNELDLRREFKGIYPELLKKP